MTFPALTSCADATGPAAHHAGPTKVEHVLKLRQ
jgi:hypothetical protein